MLATAVGGGVEAGELRVVPEKVLLDDGFARQQLLVNDGVDRTRGAAYAVSAPGVVKVDAHGSVSPVANGTAEIVVSFENQTVRVPVTVAGLEKARPVDFRNEIVPLFSRFGCNAGGCHGKASGQNGFKLSLFGFDPTFDYQALVNEGRGRRVFAADPDRSLLLEKGAGRVPHGGGRRIIPGTEAYQILHAWIEQGMPASAATAPQLKKIVVSPPEALFRNGGQQQLAVTAEYADGRTRDVTAEVQFASNLDPVASVSDDGYVQTNGNSGEATIMARYMGQVAVFRAIVPHGEPLSAIPDFPVTNEIDRLAAEKWKKLGLLPSAVCDDATFLRRITVDLCGRLPTPDEVRNFLADQSPDKRTQLVDKLLVSPDYPAYFAMRWSTILRNSQLAGSTQAAYAFHNWIKDLIARNAPYDELVRGVVAAAGEWQDAPAVNWYWQMRDDQLHQVTADTAQVFLGLRLQCARCHHHPYERFGQEDYYGLAGFFTRLGRKSFGEPPPYFNAGRVTMSAPNPITGKQSEPKFLDGPVAEFSAEQDPRHALVDWMTKPENPFFSKVLVNRLWGHFLGRGLVSEVDDLRETNPPSNPELLDFLARDFVEHKFDMRRTIRMIVTSRVYQLDSQPTEHNLHDTQNHARFYARRLVAEVFHDAVDQATGSRTRFSGVSSEARAVDLPHEGFGSYFLDTFDRPRRVSGCECERSANATLAQVLLLANSDEIENKIADGNGRIGLAIKANKTDAEIVDDIYLSTLSRFPKPDEAAKLINYIASQPQPDRAKACEDVLWSVLNSKEFMFNH